MLERIVENWLTSASEISLQGAFAQLLLAEGHAILHGPAHHPFEHGKDLVTVDPAGQICAFQLKAGDIDIAELRRIKSQLLTMVETSISYPGTSQAHLPEKAFLVATGSLSPPARDELRALNDGNQQRNLIPIEPIERLNLVHRFGQIHTSFPTLENLQLLLTLLTADGRGPFRTTQFLGLVERMLDDAGPDPSDTAARRAIAEALLITAYATSAWAQQHNDLALAEAWLSMACSVLRMAMKASPNPRTWSCSYEIALAIARGHLDAFVTEAAGAKDLVFEHIAESLIYPARALIVCGWAAAFLLSEHTQAQQAGGTSLVPDLIARELPYARAPGESGAPHLFAIAKALEVLRKPREAANLIGAWLALVAERNQLSAPSNPSPALPNPYYSLEDAIRVAFGVYDWRQVPERFDGRAYSALKAIHWLARRDIRDPVEQLYPSLSRLVLVDVEVSAPFFCVSADDPNATTRLRQLPTPGSWSALRKEASESSDDTALGLLAQHLEIVPFLGLILPHRFNRAVAALLDRLG